MFKRNQKGSATLWIILIVVVLLILFGFFALQSDDVEIPGFEVNKDAGDTMMEEGDKSGNAMMEEGDKSDGAMMEEGATTTPDSSTSTDNGAGAGVPNYPDLGSGEPEDNAVDPDSV